MADQQFYSIRPKQPFMFADVMFYPGRGEYIVSEQVYNSKTADGLDFKDLCDATPVNPPGS
jgi:hypothetical protein